VTFSIVTVCRNDLDGIVRTHESVRGQTTQDLEWLVIDGASTDGTADWLASHVDPSQWTSEPDEGLYDAMNKGLERASGDYVIFMNSGDGFADERVLENVNDTLRQSDQPPDLMFGDAIDLYPEGREYYRVARSHRALWYGMFARHQSIFFRRDRIGGLRYPEQFQLSGDYAFLCAFLSDRHEEGPPVVVRHHFAICKFDMGGMSNSKRVQAMKEDLRIRREYLGQPRLTRAALWVAHRLHLVLKQRTPGLARRLRDRSTVTDNSR
jgi:putative colanic acid biosynthesis glycosyltransferase